MLAYSVDIHKPTFESCSSYSIQNYVSSSTDSVGLLAQAKLSRLTFQLH